MTIDKLKNIAEHIENGLLEKLANRQITDYSVEIMLNDGKINVTSYDDSKISIGRSTVTLFIGNNSKFTIK